MTNVYLYYQVTHLPVTEETVKAAIENAHATYNDLDALYWSVANHPEMGWGSPWLDEINAAIDRLQCPRLEAAPVFELDSVTLFRWMEGMV